MSLPAQGSSSAKSVTPEASEDGWADVKPRKIGHEDSLSDSKRDAIWSDIYRRAKMSSASEKDKKALRLAVYAYCCINGTSREGAYETPMVLSNGALVDAAIIPQSTTRMHIRKFMRSNMNESYTALKASKVIEEDGRYIAKVAAYGIAPECAFATADWLDDCALFTPAEAKAHDTAFARGVDRAARARGGHTLEEVESQRGREHMEVQGPAVGQAQGRRIDF